MKELVLSLILVSYPVSAMEKSFSAEGHSNAVQLNSESLNSKNLLLPLIDSGDYTLDQIQQCLNDGEDVNAQKEDGKTALYIVAEKGNFVACALLLKYGADVGARLNDGSTPLHLAAQNGHGEVCLLLLEKGASFNAVSGSGWTPLHIAAQNGHGEVCLLLL